MRRSGIPSTRKRKLPVYSLYGDAPKKTAAQSAADYDLVVLQARAPKPEQLQDLDALVFDLQDVGARFYTYSATLGVALEAAARAHKKFFVLDRVNPITAARFEGPVLSRPISFRRLPCVAGAARPDARRTGALL